MGHKPGNQQVATLVLEDGSSFSGFSFGAQSEVHGEVVFNTGMVGYPESFTDPSYRGQILTLTYPLIGNYGVPASTADALQRSFESDAIHLSGLIVAEYSQDQYHWESASDLSSWLVKENIPGICGIDTRELTKKLRSVGTMKGMIIQKAPAQINLESIKFSSTEDASNRHLVSAVSISSPVTYQGKSKRVALIDCGCKNTITRSLISRGVTVIRVPWNYDVTTLDVDGVLCSNGPGNPADNPETIENIKKIIAADIPFFGICLGHQLLSLAVGAKTYKLKFGHRSQNQPCRIVGSSRCYITSQNHGYAVDVKTLPNDWEAWFENANDGTSEGIRHKSKPFMSVQFHPEAMPGPVDTGFLFDNFIGMLS